MDSTANETGFRVERCSGAGCSNFALLANLAANTTAYTDSGLTASTASQLSHAGFQRDRYVGVDQRCDGDHAGCWERVVHDGGAGEITNCRDDGLNRDRRIVKGMLSDTNVIVFTAGTTHGHGAWDYLR